VLVLLADEQRFELPAGFSVRVREILAKEFENANSDDSGFEYWGFA
jgi:hypothetical protein